MPSALVGYGRKCGNGTVGRMRKMLDGGKTFQDVATEFGVSRERIRKVAGEHGLVSRRAEERRRERLNRVLPLMRQGLLVKEVARRLGVAGSTVSKKLRSLGTSGLIEKARAARLQS